MKIRFKKRRLQYNLIFGIIWLVFGTAAIIFNSENSFNYGYLIIGTLYLFFYLFENNKQYITIKNGVITKNNLIPKRVTLNEINRIKKFAGDYVLKTKASELRINTELIEKKSLIELDNVLKNLNLETNKTF